MSIKSIIKKLFMLSKEKKLIPIIHLTESTKILDGQVALIVGGSGGIGIGIARSFIESGCKVIIAGTKLEKLEYYSSQIREKYPERISTLKLDLLDIKSFHNKIKEASNIYGKIDILVNAAGVHTSNIDLWNVTSEEFDKVMNINLKGPYFFSIITARYMRDNHIKGHILYISSSRGLEPAWSPYGLSKWGINGMVKGLGKMFIPYGIVVNAIAPGSTATELLGYKDGDSIFTAENAAERYIMPDEIGIYAKLLVSDAGNMLIGETINISGGRGVFDIR